MPKEIDLGVGVRYRAHCNFHSFLDQGKSVEEAINLMLDHYPTLRSDHEFLDYLR